MFGLAAEHHLISVQYRGKLLNSVTCMVLKKHVLPCMAFILVEIFMALLPLAARN